MKIGGYQEDAATFRSVGDYKLAAQFMTVAQVYEELRRRGLDFSQKYFF